ncbi:phage major capsid protein [Mycobacteroides abscessus]|uniref:phage major capsid protein n=1 Tax=Mycobacteroides abscessus TaxID=36809 RepID=UPI00092A3D6F|nr:phage major capsid protein [Mycobacteroides abscessus]DAZ90344.1 TPA_asm: major capsid protein [Mycobacterium phage prophiFSQJ01-1]SII41281.1 Predicted phage phi-C31 gp36 major capsid-like protein [Mycobacteroides abscessus subsp. abscessus]SIK13893.1 Predicted phage phi-C31 gp36 major capsid-like protein [Mycobacteroides abscessus subsp. abscessus]SIN25559.1 Predicted phage phi-C31 gp36 major capsid-like protein [Mycobacteroides abscessus subsp. abscessus]SLI51356.1 Predicted phage phi-C31
MAGIDINRTTNGVLLPPVVSKEIWQSVQQASIIQQLVPQIDLPAGGMSIPIITGDPQAEWVDETEEKPVSRGSLSSKNIKGYTLAVIVPFSNQFKRDLPGLYNAMTSRLPRVLAKKFDRTCLGFDPSPGTGFDTLASAPTASIATNVYDGYVDALESVASVEGSDVERWVLTSQAEIAALGAKDGMGRPIFIDSVTAQGRVDREILARPVSKTPHAFKGGSPSTVGFGGEWSTAMWGYVEGLRVDVSSEATLTDGNETLNLWQRNMFAVRVEFEVGFAVRDVNRFVRITGANTGAGS